MGQPPGTKGILDEEWACDALSAGFFLVEVRYRSGDRVWRSATKVGLQMLRHYGGVQSVIYAKATARKAWADGL